MSTIFTVSNEIELQEALSEAGGGDTIELLAGEYGDLSLYHTKFDSDIKITSADPQEQAIFSSVSLTDVANITFDNIFVDFVPDEDTVEWSSAVKIVDSEGVSIQNSIIEGGDSVAGVSEDSERGEQGSQGILGWPTGRGISVSGSTGTNIENNEISEFHRGIILSKVDDISITGTEVHHVRASTLAGGDIQNATIEDNHFHSSHPWKYGGSGDHGDYIFFWTGQDQSEPNQNIVIKDNVLEQGDGFSLLGILFQDQSLDQVGSTNVQIEGNVIHNGHNLGIVLDGMRDVQVANNTLLLSDGTAPGIFVKESVENVVISGNISSGVGGPGMEAAESHGIQTTNNVTVQYENMDDPGYFGNLFFGSYLTAEGPSSIKAVPGSEADGVGAPTTQLDTTPGSVTPIFQVSSLEVNAQTLVFDASYTYGPTGQITPADATFLWHFGDGTSVEGRIVEHNYDGAGNYNVVLQVLVDGQSMATTASAKVDIAGNDVLAFSANDGFFYAQSYGTEVEIGDSNTASVNAETGMAIDLGGVGTAVEIPKEALSSFFGVDTFEMSMTLQADQAGASWGEIARIHGSIIISIEQDGDLRVRLFPDSGDWVDLSTSGIALNDGATHDISVVVSSETNSLDLIVDGNIVATDAVTGSMPGIGYAGLVFGEPWGGQNFDGKLSAFELDAVSTDYPAFEGQLEGPIEGHDEGFLPIIDDFIADFEQLQEAQLLDDAEVVTSSDSSDVHLDGEGDFAKIGKLSQFEESDQVSLSVTWSKDSLDSHNERLAWNNKNVGVSVKGDGLKIYVSQEGERFHDTINIKNLGLHDTDIHQVIVMVDATSDRLQVILDDVLVLDQQDLDITFADGIDKAWKIGGGRRHFLDGEIHDFRVDGEVDFLPESALVQDDASLMG